MENYTSDSSDGENDLKTIDLAYLLRNPESVEHYLNQYLDNDSKKYKDIEKIILHHNELHIVPRNISR